MIMVKLSSNFSKENSYYGYEDSYKGYDGYCSLGSDPDHHHHHHHQQVVVHMADQDESRTCSSVNEEEGEAGSSSRDVVAQRDDDDDKWLQLGLGNQVMSTTGSQTVEPVGTRRTELVELDLLPTQQQQQQQQQQRQQQLHLQHVKPLAPIHHFVTSTTNMSPSLIFQHPVTTLGLPLHPEISPGYRPYMWNPMASSSSISVPPQPPPSRGMYYPPPPPPPSSLQYHGMEIVGPSSTMRVVDAPPRAPKPSVWFMLKASQNQAKEPFLPQIPKSYLRIKDGRMTVSLLMKYLVNKLRLNSESEIEITCRGQQLPPFFTLQYVRDNIWSSVNVVTLNPETSTSDHVMILNYGRSA